MIVFGVLLLLGVTVAASYRLGMVAGGRSLWKQLKSDRLLGGAALEKLAEAHGAKVELSDHGIAG